MWRVVSTAGQEVTMSTRTYLLNIRPLLLVLFTTMLLGSAHTAEAQNSE